MKVTYFGSVAVCLFVVFISVSSHPNRNRGGNRRNPCNPSERYHKETERCHPIGTKGPCGDNMIFIEDKAAKTQGICECDDHIGCDYWPFTYWEPTRQCYPLFAQGPCQDGEWLVTHEHTRHRKNGRKLRGECRRRDCDPGNSPGKTFLHQGNCFEVGTQAFCSRPQENVYFGKGNGVPMCFNRPEQTDVCQAAKQGGGTIQQVIIITPSPVSPIPPPPAAAVPASALIEPRTSENMSPAPPSPGIETVSPMPLPSPPPPTLGSENITLPDFPMISTKTLSNAGQIPCAGGRARSSTGDCSPRALL